MSGPIAWTYSGDPSTSPADQLRFAIGDTRQKEPLLSDGEIAFILNRAGGDVQTATILALQGLIVVYARAVDETVGPVSKSYSQRLGQLQKALDLFNTAGGSGGAAVLEGNFLPRSPGIFRDTKALIASDPNRVAPAFTVAADNPERAVIRMPYGAGSPVTQAPPSTTPAFDGKIGTPTAPSDFANAYGNLTPQTLLPDALFVLAAKIKLLAAASGGTFDGAALLGTSVGSYAGYGAIDATLSIAAAVALLNAGLATVDGKAIAAQAAADAAQDSADAAATSASTAQSQASAANTAATQAETHAQQALTNAQTGIDDADAAHTAALAAGAAATSAQTAASAAQADATQALTNAATANAAALAAATAASQAQTLASAAQSTADLAETHAQTGITNAATAQGAANTANTKATQALADAATAQAAANAAQASANTAKTAADNAQATATQALADAATANAAAATADGKAVAAQSTANSAQTTASNAQTAATNAQSTADSASAAAATNTTAIQALRDLDKMLVGSGTPAGGLGNDGDVYLDIDTGKTYGPKASGAWGTSNQEFARIIGNRTKLGTLLTKKVTSVPSPDGSGNYGMFGTTDDGEAFYSRPDGVTYALTPPQSGGGGGGSQGPTGPAGAKGDKGDRGDDGNTLITGTSDPDNSTGKNGDSYYNTSSHTFFSPKASGSWPMGVQLVGPQGASGTPGAAGSPGQTGAAGADGLTILNGTGVPLSGIGRVGDFYIRTDAPVSIYGPKTSGGWGAATPIVGPQGATGQAGNDGAPGSPGTPGAAGSPGVDGRTIYNGTAAPASGLGNTGDLFLNTATSSYYIKQSSSNWGSATSLVGAAGQTGSPGADGAIILSGTAAPSGGKDGDFYLRNGNTLYGPRMGGVWPGTGTSLVGPAGSDGAPGQAGGPGAPGVDGKTLRNGAGSPSNALGNDGDFYINTSTNFLHGPKASGTWPTGVSLVGPQGTQGSPGTAGVDGKTIRSGTSAPSAGLGNDGDIYIKTDAPVTLYGPKASGSWGSGTSLVGPQGQTGATGTGTQGNPGVDGKSVRSGSGAPSSGLGSDGDFYIKTDAPVTLYGPKTSGAWGSGVSLVGPQGTSGTAGANGADGKTIRNGTGVPSSGLGVDGDFYIRTDAPVGIYGPKTSGAWGGATSLVGPQGTQGVQGNAGADGRTIYNGTSTPSAGLGANGDLYLNTANNTYQLKVSGAWSTAVSMVGPQGTAGTAGGAGSAGVDGKTVRNGAGTPSSGLGVDGDFYYDTTNKLFYGPKTSGAWGSGTSIVGPSGGGSVIQVSSSTSISPGSGDNGKAYQLSGNATVNLPTSNTQAWTFVFMNTTDSNTITLNGQGFPVVMAGYTDTASIAQTGRGTWTRLVKNSGESNWFVESFRAAAAEAYTLTSF